jgi:predicted dehydrogenase
MTSWKRRLRFGMVGGGQGAFIGAVHRIAAALDGQAELVAGCFSRDPANTRETGARLYLDPARCYATYGEMAEREAKLPPDRRIDFVSVVTQTAAHHAIAKTFLEHGFHVVCDKPMTVSVAEAEELARIVDRTGLVFALTHNYTGYPLVRHARELFRSGKMGKVRKVVIEYLQDFLMYPHEKEGMKQAVWRTDPAQAGPGGTLGDVGTHCENIFEYITGERITELCADIATFLPDRKLDEDANILLRLGGGGKGLITVSQIATGEENGLRVKIYGSEGGISWEQENPNYLTLLGYNRPRQVLGRGHGEYLSPAAADATRVPSGHPEGFLECFANIYCGAITAIRAKLDPAAPKPAENAFPTVHDGLRGMRFVEAVIRSARAGSTWVKV